MLPERFTPQYLKQLELFKLRARRAFLGTRQGGHLSLKRGHGIEFSDYRQYQLGDNPRHIDWGLFGRSERLYVKRFSEEQELSVLILLDTSASMGAIREEGKWEFARDLALSLAYIALMEQDSVLLPLPKSVAAPKYHGGRAIHRLSEDLQAVLPGAENDFVASATRAVSQVHFPGVAVVISDFMLSLETCMKVFAPLRAMNLDITALQVLGTSDIEGLPTAEYVTAFDSESGERLEIGLDEAARKEYRFHLERHHQELREYLASARISLVQADARTALSEFVIRNLPRTGLLK